MKKFWENDPVVKDSTPTALQAGLARLGGRVLHIGAGGHPSTPDEDAGLQEDLVEHLERAFLRYSSSLLSTTAAAAVLAVTTPTIRRWRRQGKLKPVPIPCGCIRFTRAEVARIAEERSIQKTTAGVSLKDRRAVSTGAVKDRESKRLARLKPLGKE